MGGLLVLGYVGYLQYPVAPTWQVHLQESADAPAANVPVTENWVAGSAETEMNVTDAHGDVTFSQRSVRGGFFVGVWVTLRRDAIARLEERLLGQIPCVKVTDTHWRAATMECADVGTVVPHRTVIAVAKQ